MAVGTVDRCKLMKWKEKSNEIFQAHRDEAAEWRKLDLFSYFLSVELSP